MASEWQPSLLVWGPSSSESCHSPVISSHSYNCAIITVYSINVCALVLVTCLAIGVYRSFAVATFNAIWFANLGLLSASHNMLTTFDGGNSFIALNSQE